MGVIHVDDALSRGIEQEVAQGRAPSAEAFLQEAVLRLVDASDAEEDDILRVAEAGIADMEAGRYTTVATAENARRLEERPMQRLLASLAADR